MVGSGGMWGDMGPMARVGPRLSRLGPSLGAFGLLAAGCWTVIFGRVGLNSRNKKKLAAPSSELKMFGPTRDRMKRTNVGGALSKIPISTPPRRKKLEKKVLRRLGDVFFALFVSLLGPVLDQFGGRLTSDTEQFLEQFFGAALEQFFLPPKPQNHKLWI